MVHSETVCARLVLVGDAQLLDRLGIRRRAGRHEQPLVTHHLVQHDVGLEQIDPRLRVEQLAWANRRGAAILTAPALHVDPDLGLGGVDRLDEAGGPHAGDRADERKRGNEPLEAQHRTQDAAPIDAALGTVSVERCNAALRQRRCDLRWDERCGQVADRHQICSRRVG